MWHFISCFLIYNNFFSSFFHSSSLSFTKPQKRYSAHICTENNSKCLNKNIIKKYGAANHQTNQPTHPNQHRLLFNINGKYSIWLVWQYHTGCYKCSDIENCDDIFFPGIWWKHRIFVIFFLSSKSTRISTDLILCYLELFTVN